MVPKFYALPRRMILTTKPIGEISAAERLERLKGVVVIPLDVITANEAWKIVPKGYTVLMDIDRDSYPV